MLELAPGARLHRGFFDTKAQGELLRAIERVIAEAPLVVPTMPRTGKPFSVRMTNCGALGWVSDKERGYRYEPRHPETAKPWPAIPPMLLEAWERLADSAFPPDACLVNFYGPKAHMGLHQDRDEKDLSAPILSVSLGASCLFRLGDEMRGGPTQSVALHAGDALVLSGPSRLCFHGVDKILPTPASKLAGGARINLTLRRAG